MSTAYKSSLRTALKVSCIVLASAIPGLVNAQAGALPLAGAPISPCYTTPSSDCGPVAPSAVAKVAALSTNGANEEYGYDSNGTSGVGAGLVVSANGGGSSGSTSSGNGAGKGGSSGTSSGSSGSSSGAGGTAAGGNSSGGSGGTGGGVGNSNGG